MKTLFTIGYEGADLSDFIATLRISGVRHLLDVRALAQSRRRGFSKTALSNALFDAGIHYTHLKQLGDPKPGRDAARQGKMDEFRKIFGAHLELAETKDALIEASELCEQQPTVLLCFERDPQHCHRTLVAKQLAALCSLSVRHLGVVRNAGEHSNEFAEAA